MRRGEFGHHHHIARPYLIRFAQESAWREDHRKDPNGSQVDRVVALAMHGKPKRRFLRLLAAELYAIIPRAEPLDGSLTGYG
jgi:hypothetical protein